jgi:hypothetical protein
MATSFSKLVQMMERGSVPKWVRTEIVAKRDEIAAALRSTGSYTLVGPNGNRFTIQADKKAVAAA